MDDLLPAWLQIFILIIVVFWGLALGSFTTCVVYRVPRKLSIWRGQDGSYRSFCPECHAELHTKDLIPVFSWLIQKGRCRYCGAKIPVRYLLIEMVMLALVLGLYALFGIHPLFFGVSLLLPVIAGILSFFLFRQKL